MAGGHRGQDEHDRLQPFHLGRRFSAGHNQTEERPFGDDAEGQRITRAKTKIKAARIPYRVPPRRISRGTRLRRTRHSNSRCGTRQPLWLTTLAQRYATELSPDARDSMTAQTGFRRVWRAAEVRVLRPESSAAWTSVSAAFRASVNTALSLREAARAFAPS